MAYELYYTSAPRGLQPQTSGICTVGLTRGFPAPFISRIEALSGYRKPRDNEDPSVCPVAFSHWIVEGGGVSRHVLSSVRMAPPDHTGRTNKFAHHLLLRDEECVPAGPSWLLQQPGVVADSWTGEPRELPQEKQLPTGGRVDAGVCVSWHRASGDAGWAGVLANAASLDPSKACSVIVSPGTNALALITEAMLLLPVELRWRVTFTSYFMEPIAGVRCVWRFCVDGTPAAAAARASGGTCIDISAHARCTRTGRFIEFARTGVMPKLKLQTTENQPVGEGAAGTGYALVPEMPAGETAVARPYGAHIRPSTSERSEIVTTVVQQWSKSAVFTVVGVAVVLCGLLMFKWSAVSKDLTDEKAKVAELENGLAAEKAKVAERTKELAERTKELAAEKATGAERTKELAAEKAKVAELTNELAAEKAKVAELTNELAAEKAKVAKSGRNGSQGRPPMPTRKNEWVVKKMVEPTRQEVDKLRQNWAGKCRLVEDVAAWEWISSKESNTLELNNNGILTKAEAKTKEIAKLDLVNDSFLQLEWSFPPSTQQPKVMDYVKSIETTGLFVRKNGGGEEWIRFSDWIDNKVCLDRPTKLSFNKQVGHDFQCAFEGGEWNEWNADTQRRFTLVVPGNAGSLIFEFRPNDSTTDNSLVVSYEWPDNLSDAALQAGRSDTLPNESNKPDETKEALERKQKEIAEKDKKRNEIAEQASKQKLLLGLKGEVPKYYLQLNITYQPTGNGGGK